MNELQSCWEKLGIEAIRDKRAIKSRYAKLLKTTRPDDDPVAFQQLYNAYEDALYYVDQAWYWEEHDAGTFDDVETSVPPWHVLVKQDEKFSSDLQEAESVIESNLVTAGNEHSYSTAQLRYFNDLQIHIGSLEKRNSQEAWQAFLADDLLYQISFKQAVSFYIIEQLLEIKRIQLKCLKNTQSKPKHVLEPMVLVMLNDYFQWLTNVIKIEQHFGFYVGLTYVLDDLEEAHQPYYQKSIMDYEAQTNLLNVGFSNASFQQDYSAQKTSSNMEDQPFFESQTKKKLSNFTFSQLFFPFMLPKDGISVGMVIFVVVVLSVMTSHYYQYQLEQGKTKSSISKNIEHNPYVYIDENHQLVFSEPRQVEHSEFEQFPLKSYQSQSMTQDDVKKLGYDYKKVADAFDYKNLWDSNNNNRVDAEEWRLFQRFVASRTQ